MGNQDLSQVRLVDMGYGSNWGFYNSFLSRGISTVAQVLDDDLMDEVISHTRKQKTRDELRGFIDLIKYEFLGKELTTTPLLDEPANKLWTLEMNESSINLSRMGFLDKEKPSEMWWLSQMYDRYLKAHPEDNQEAKIIDVFRDALGNRDPRNRFEKKVKIMINSYDRSKDCNLSLERLKKDLENLKRERSKIDEKIEHLEKQIESIKGGPVK